MSNNATHAAGATSATVPAPAAVPAADIEALLHLYQQMVAIRHFEDAVNDLYLSAKMPGLAHLYIGQEAVAVGVCDALRRDDYITSTHRGHGHCLAKGAEPGRMFAELLGKEAGYCHGKGGSMHIADPESGNLGANAIVGGSMGIAVGAALSAKLRGTDQVAVCLFGEGAVGQGLFYEVMNMASLWSLPVLFVCENNLYSEYTYYRETMAGELIARAAAFGIDSMVVDGQDVVAVNNAARAIVGKMRTSAAPFFLQCNTYRYHGHHVGDIDRKYYRSKAEEEEWHGRDPITLLGDVILAGGRAHQALLDQINQDVAVEIAQAVEFGLAAAYPESAEVERFVYA